MSKYEHKIYAEGSYWIDPGVSPARREIIEKAIIRSMERERQRGMVKSLNEARDK